MESQVVGNKTTDLLREVVVDDGQGDPVRYEPTHPQFIPVRKRNFDSITIEMYSTSGKLIKFDHGKTLVTLLFSRRRHRILKREQSRVIIHYVLNTTHDNTLSSRRHAWTRS